MPRAVPEGALDGLRHAGEQRMRVGRSIGAQEACGPARDVGRLRRLRDVARKRGAFVRRVGERIGRVHDRRDIVRVEAGRRVIDANRAFEVKLRRAVCEARGRDVIAEGIPRPGRSGSARA